MVIPYHYHTPCRTGPAWLMSHGSNDGLAIGLGGLDGSQAGAVGRKGKGWADGEGRGREGMVFGDAFARVMEGRDVVYGPCLCAVLPFPGLLLLVGLFFLVCVVVVSFQSPHSWTFSLVISRSRCTVLAHPRPLLYISWQRRRKCLSQTKLRSVRPLYPNALIRCLMPL